VVPADDIAFLFVDLGPLKYNAQYFVPEHIGKYHSVVIVIVNVCCSLHACVIHFYDY